MNSSPKLNIPSDKICTLIIIGYIIIIFSPAFLNKGPLLQTDQAYWTAITYIYKSEVVPTQKWFWSTITDRAGAGWVEGAGYSMSLMLPWALSYLSDAATAVKAATLLSALFFVLSFYFVARCYMIGIYALSCSLVLLTPSFDKLVGGMWYNYIALGFAFVFWISCEKFFNKGNAVFLVAAIISFALSIYSHALGVFVCLAVWGSFVIIVLIFKDNIKSNWLISFIPFVASLLAFPQIQATLGINTYHATKNNLTTPNFEITGFVEIFQRLLCIKAWNIHSISDLTIFTSTSMLAVIMLFMTGIYALIKRNEINKLIPVFLLIIITAVLVSKIYNILGLNLDILKNLSFYYRRFQIFAQIYLILLSGVGLQFLAESSRNAIQKRGWLKSSFIVLFLLFILIAVVTPKKIFIDKTKQFGTLETSIFYEDVMTLWGWINENIESNNERVYFEDTSGTMCWNRSSYEIENRNNHVLALTSIYTDVHQANGFCNWPLSLRKQWEKWSYGAGRGLFGKSFKDDEISDDFIYDEMKMLNSKYLVANSEIVKARLLKVPFLKSVARFNQFQVFENTAFESAWAYKLADGKRVELIKHSSVHYELLAKGQKDEPIHISLAYYPNWRATYKNGEIPIDEHRQLMRINLPVDGEQSIHLRYVFKKQTAIILFLAGLFLLLVFIFLIPKLNLVAVADQADNSQQF